MTETDYVPAEGDVINVKLTVTLNGAARYATANADHHAIIGPDTLAMLIESGAVELVRRAEPDWQYGDFGVDRKTGEVFRYLPDGVDAEPWFACAPNHPLASGDGWLLRSQLAGKLDRFLLAPAGRVTPWDPDATTILPTIEDDHEW